MVSVGVWSAEVGFCRPEGNQAHFHIIRLKNVTYCRFFV